MQLSHFFETVFDIPALMLFIVLDFNCVQRVAIRVVIADEGNLETLLLSIALHFTCISLDTNLKIKMKSLLKDLPYIIDGFRIYRFIAQTVI